MVAGLLHLCYSKNFLPEKEKKKEEDENLVLSPILLLSPASCFRRLRRFEFASASDAYFLGPVKEENGLKSLPLPPQKSSFLAVSRKPVHSATPEEKKGEKAAFLMFQIGASL